MVNSRSLDNLRPKEFAFNAYTAKEAQKKGVESRKANKTITQALLALLEEEHTLIDETTNKPVRVYGAEIVAAILFKKAKNEGNLKAIQMIYERLEGLPKQYVTVSNETEIFDSEIMRKIKSEIEERQGVE